MQKQLIICEQAARAGGALLLQWIGRFAVREKGPSDLVTEADCASQEAIRSILLADFPDYGFVSEEDQDRTALATHEFCWVVDPLDGTLNYVHTVPHYAVSVALVERGVPVVGVIYDPVQQECFAASRGGGAYLNRKRIHASNVAQLSEALAVASFASKVDRDSVEVDQFVAALFTCQGVRRTGSAALNLCYVAMGRFDAFWALTTKAWDVAAGVLLVEEAGGIVTGPTGGPFSLDEPYPVACANRDLHRQFLDVLLHASPSRH